MYNKITSTSLLKWYCEKTKGRDKKFHPCFVHPNFEERISGLQLQQPKKDEVLIEYLGLHWSDAKKLQIVPKRKLEPFDFDGDGDANWSQRPMKTHLAAIKNQKAFQSNKELKLRTEELVLRNLLDDVRKREKKKATAKASDDDDDDDISEASSSPVNSPVRISAPRQRPTAPTANQVKTLRAGDVISYWYV